jgi:hypothetical protein
VFDGDVLLNAKSVHQAGHRRPAETAHEVIFKGEVETGRPWFALTTCPSSQLVVYAPCLVPLGAEDMQAAQFKHLFPATHIVGVDFSDGAVELSWGSLVGI